MVDATLYPREPLGLEAKCVGRIPDAIPEDAVVGIDVDRADFCVFHPDTGGTLLHGLATPTD